ncbi:MAG TPA: hypothetical protein VFI76_02525 [Terrimicrobiaceae bacterium]|nr:hypothetical protein [Terrimicrobiaceae bacterium]
MKTLLACWIANRNQVRARALRRSLRDYQRREYAYITALEERSRGLRLYAAWAGKKSRFSIHEVPERWQLSQVTAGAFHENVKAAA